MFRTTKLRTIFATLAAAVAVTVAVVPAAHAAKNDGGYATSAEAQKQKVCDYAWSLFEDAVNRADKADDAGDLQGMKDALGDAKFYLDVASTLGCGWAARSAPVLDRIHDRVPNAGNLPTLQPADSPTVSPVDKATVEKIRSRLGN